jgi:hypothetical protein
MLLLKHEAHQLKVHNVLSVPQLTPTNTRIVHTAKFTVTTVHKARPQDNLVHTTTYAPYTTALPLLTTLRRCCGMQMNHRPVVSSTAGRCTCRATVKKATMISSQIANVCQDEKVAYMCGNSTITPPQRP